MNVVAVLIRSCVSRISLKAASSTSKLGPGYKWLHETFFSFASVRGTGYETDSLRGQALTLMPEHCTATIANISHSAWKPRHFQSGKRNKCVNSYSIFYTYNVAHMETLSLLANAKWLIVNRCHNFFLTRTSHVKRCLVTGRGLWIKPDWLGFFLTGT